MYVKYHVTYETPDTVYELILSASKKDAGVISNDFYKLLADKVLAKYSKETAHEKLNQLALFVHTHGGNVTAHDLLKFYGVDI